MSCANTAQQLGVGGRGVYPGTDRQPGARPENRDRGGRGTMEPAGRFRHEALFYANASDYVADTARYVREGLAAGESVLVAVVEERARLLREELGADAGAVDFLDMAEVGRNPARIIPAWQEWVERNTARGTAFRGV